MEWNMEYIGRSYEWQTKQIKWINFNSIFLVLNGHILNGMDSEKCPGCVAVLCCVWWMDKKSSKIKYVQRRRVF